MAEIVRRTLDVDVCFLPGLNFGVPLRPGPVTGADLAQFFPMAVQLWTCRMSGSQIRSALEQTLWTQDYPDSLRQTGGLLQSAGLVWEYGRGGKYWQRVQGVWTGQPGEAGRSREPLEPARLYRVAIPDWLAIGGHYQKAFLSARERQRTDWILPDLLTKELSRHGPVRRLPPNLRQVP